MANYGRTNTHCRGCYFIHKTDTQAAHICELQAACVRYKEQLHTAELEIRNDRETMERLQRYKRMWDRVPKVIRKLIEKGEAHA